MRSFVSVCLLAGSLSWSGCLQQEEALTREEAREAVDEANLSSSAQALTYDVIEVSTSFTLGAAARDAAQELSALLRSQVPCSTVTLDAPTVTIDFGSVGDRCSFRGRTYAGIAKITVMRTEPKELEVYHEWKGLSDGQVTLDGWARVTWSGTAQSRHVEHEIDWTAKNREGTFHAEGDRTQRLIDPALGLRGGLVIDGSRSWSSGERTWTLAIDGVEVRGLDPVPQAGTYTLTTPRDKTITMSFTRLDGRRIRVTVEGSSGRSFDVDVVSIE